MTTRRKMFAAVGLCVLAVLFSSGPVSAQPTTRIYHIGTLDYSDSDAGRLAWWKAFRDRLRELGYIEGRNLVIEARFAAGKQEQLTALAAELVKLKVDLIAVGGTIAALAAKRATSQIPIVTATGIDPLRVGLVSSLARPGGNVTGVISLGNELSAKRLELMRIFVPGVSRVGVVMDETNPASHIGVKDTQAAASSLGMTIVVRGVSNAADYEAAFDALREAGSQVLVIISSPAFFSNRKRLLNLALKNRLPAMVSAREYAQAGSLVSYGTDYPHLFRRAAEYADKILKGAKPGELPIEQPSKFELVVNLKTAKALGITIPQSVLVRADEVIR